MYICLILIFRLCCWSVCIYTIICIQCGTNTVYTIFNRLSCGCSIRNENIFLCSGIIGFPYLYIGTIFKPTTSYIQIEPIASGLNFITIVCLNNWPLLSSTIILFPNLYICASIQRRLAYIQAEISSFWFYFIEPISKVHQSPCITSRWHYIRFHRIHIDIVSRCHFCSGNVNIIIHVDGRDNVIITIWQSLSCTIRYFLTLRRWWVYI